MKNFSGYSYHVRLFVTNCPVGFKLWRISRGETLKDMGLSLEVDRRDIQLIYFDLWEMFFVRKHGQPTLIHGEISFIN